MKVILLPDSAETWEQMRDSWVQGGGGQSCHHCTALLRAHRARDLRAASAAWAEGGRPGWAPACLDSVLRLFLSQVGLTTKHRSQQPS